MPDIERVCVGSRSGFTHGSLRSSWLAPLVAPVGVGFSIVGLRTPKNPSVRTGFCLGARSPTVSKAHADRSDETAKAVRSVGSRG